MTLLNQRQLVPNTSIISANKLPSQLRCTIEGHLAKSVVMEVKNGRHFSPRVALKRAMTLLKQKCKG